MTHAITINITFIRSLWHTSVYTLTALAFLLILFLLKILASAVNLRVKFDRR